MEYGKWECPDCGEVNSGNFCAKCGRSKSGGSYSSASGREDRLTQMRLRREQRMQEQERRYAFMEERERQLEEYNQQSMEYSMKSAEIPVNVMKQWAGTPVVLIAAIAATVLALCSVIGVITKFSDRSYFSCVIEVVKFILNCCLAVGFWKTFTAGRSKSVTDYSAGPRMVRSVFNFYRVLTIIALVLVVVGTIILAIGLKSCADSATDAAGGMGYEEITEAAGQINSGITTILIVLVVVMVIVTTLVIISFNKIMFFGNCVVDSFRTKNIVTCGTVFVAVIFFLIGAITLISGFGSAVTASLLHDVLNEAQQGMPEFVQGMIPDVQTDFSEVASGIAGGIVSVTVGILALQFGKLPYKAEMLINELEKPVKPI